jgi:hypothetical protein
MGSGCEPLCAARDRDPCALPNMGRLPQDGCSSGRVVVTWPSGSDCVATCARSLAGVRPDATERSLTLLGIRVSLCSRRFLALSLRCVRSPPSITRSPHQLTHRLEECDGG